MSETTDTNTAGDGRMDKAKALVGQAGETLKAEAQSFAGVAQDRVRAEAQRGAQAAGKTLGDFATAVRKAGDELATADQSPAARLVRQAADGLETVSRSLADKEPGELLDAVRDFGRKNPIAFIGGAVLVGVALGRFVRASESAGAPPRLRSEEMALAEEAAYDGPSEYTDAPPVTDGMTASDELEPSTAATTASPIGVGSDTVSDGTSGLGEPDTGPTDLGRGR
jgi:hypothetical protein